MADENFNWQELINQVKSADEKEIPQAIPAPNNVVLPTALPDLVLINPQEQTVELTPLNSDVPEIENEYEEEEYEEEELLEGEPVPTASFDLSNILPQPIPAKTVVQPTKLDLGVLFNPQPQTAVSQATKRGPGRPRKVETAQQLMQQLPATIQTQEDAFKSSGINQVSNSSTESDREEKIIKVNKKTLQEIGDGFIRIGQALKEYSA